MELTKKYLDTITVMANFWVVTNGNQIVSLENEAITIEKSTIYLNKYIVKVYLTFAQYESLAFNADGWEEKFPTVIITKASGRVESYENLKGVLPDTAENHIILKMTGEKVE